MSYAAKRALINDSQGKLKTRQNLDAEVKYYLSGSNKISECVRQFTPQSSSSQIGIVVCRAADFDLFSSAAAVVKGVEMSDETFCSDVYLSPTKIESINAMFKIASTEAGSLESIIISKLAVKDI